MGEEIARRAVHASGAAVPLSHALAPDVITWDLVQFFLVGALAVATILEILRLLGNLDWAIYDRLTREYEQDNPAGYALYMLSMTVVAFAVAPTIAMPAMLMLAVADPVSGLLSAGELRPVKQGWVLLATFGVATLLAVPFVDPVPAIAGGLAATVADGLKPVIAGYVIDDNLTIPPAAAVAMVLAVHLVPA
jgi:dolichol kinase